MTMKYYCESHDAAIFMILGILIIRAVADQYIISWNSFYNSFNGSLIDSDPESIITFVSILKHHHINHLSYNS